MSTPLPTDLILLAAECTYETLLGAEPNMPALYGKEVTDKINRYINNKYPQLTLPSWFKVHIAPTARNWKNGPVLYNGGMVLPTHPDKQSLDRPASQALLDMIMFIPKPSDPPPGHPAPYRSDLTDVMAEAGGYTTLLEHMRTWLGARVTWAVPYYELVWLQCVAAKVIDRIWGDPNLEAQVRANPAQFAVLIKVAFPAHPVFDLLNVTYDPHTPASPFPPDGGLPRRSLGAFTPAGFHVDACPPKQQVDTLSGKLACPVAPLTTKSNEDAFESTAVKCPRIAELVYSALRIPCC